MSPLESAAPKRKRRWLQFSVRALLILTLLLAVLLGWLRHEINRFQAEEEAVAAIIEMGGFVLYESDPWQYDSTRVPKRGPKWLRCLLGERFFDRISSVHFPRGADDEAIQLLDRLRHAPFLNLRGARITRDGLKHVLKRRDLEYLDLSSTDVTDEELPRLVGMPRLESLILNNTAVTDRAVRTLGRLSSLREVSLEGTHVTRAGMGELCALLWPNDTLADAQDFPFPWSQARSESQRQAAALLEGWGADVRCSRADEWGEGQPITSAGYRVVVHWAWKGGPAELARLAELKDPTNLMLLRDHVTEGDVDVLRALDNLYGLALERNPLNSGLWDRLTRPRDCPPNGQGLGRGIAEGCALPNLKWLEVRDRFFCDEDLEYVGRCLNLAELDIRHARITDEGLKHLVRLTQLTSLELSGTPSPGIRGPGLVHLRGLTRLQELDLSYTGVDDDSLAHLAPLNKLERLDLSGTRVTDAGVKHLLGFRRLIRLDLPTSVTPQALAKLKAALPDAEILKRRF
jgi:Leucine-rich repeat (LRR) protein